MNQSAQKYLISGANLQFKKHNMLELTILILAICLCASYMERRKQRIHVMALLVSKKTKKKVEARILAKQWYGSTQHGALKEKRI